MGCGSSNDAAQPQKTRALRRKPDWTKIYARLPVDRTPEQQAKRAELFNQFDPNKNGYLSLAEIDKGVRDILQLEDLFDAKPVLLRAYNASRALNTKPGQGQDYVEKNEFRMLLVYLYNYLKIWEVFASADDSDDRRLNKQEFGKCFGALKKWAPDMTLDQVWNAMLAGTNNQQVLFTEFAEWAIDKQLATLVESPSAE
jgi:Ca2+-binding EF-hand superfamily protein